MTELPDGIADRLRETVLEELQAQMGDGCVQRGFATPEQVRRAVEEQLKLRVAGEPLSLLQVLLRMRFLTTQQYLGMAEGLGGAEPQQRLGRYDLLKVIGKGGIGTVYKANDTQLRRVVALKTLRTDIAPAGVVASRLIREAQATARLRHPNIVIVHDAGEIDGTPYIAMEFVDGRPLADILRSKAMAIDAVVAVVAKAAHAVSYAHSQGIVHRDLKPGNIIVRPNGEPSVIDFGLAKLADPGEAKALTQSAIGTPFYMSPEQVRDSKSAGPPTDIYALGVTLYEAMAGKPPFDGVSHFELFQRILTEDPVPPRALRPGLSADLETICLVAMAKEPGERYATASEFAADLERYLRHEPIAAKPPSMIERVGRRLGRHWIKIAAVAAVAILAVAAWSMRPRTPVDPPKAEGPRDLAKEAELLRLNRYRALQEKIKPLDTVIRETRTVFYIPDADIRARLTKLEEVLVELEKLAAEYSEFPDGWAAVGVGWYLVGELDRAATALLKAERLAPADAAVNSTLGRICLERAMAELFVDEGVSTEARRARSVALNLRAKQYFEAASTGWGASPEVDRKVAQACLALANGHLTEAEKICNEGIRLYKEEFGVEEFWYLLTWMCSGDERMRCFSEALKKRPHHAWVRLLRGNARREAWDLKGAIEDYTAALAANPRLAFAFNNRGVVRWARGELDLALDDYTAAIKLDPENATAYSNRAMVKHARGKYDDALADCDKAISLNANLAGAHANRGTIRAAKGDLDGAMADFTKSLDINPRNVGTWVGRATVKRTRGDEAGALADLEQAMKIDPGSAAPYIERATLRLSRGDLDGALHDFSAAIEREAGNAQVYAARAGLLRSKGDLPGSFRDCDEAIRLNPAMADAYGERGFTKAAIGDFLAAARDEGARAEYEGAMNDWNAAVALNEKHARSYFGRGALLAQFQREAEALVEVTKAIDCNPALIEALVLRGILREEKDFDGAMEDYNRALDVNPRSADALFNRGMAHLGKKRMREAAKDLEQALKYAPAKWNNRPLAEQGLRQAREE